VPPAREACGAPERTRAPPADGDGRMRPLARLRLEADAVEGREPAGETRHLLGPEHADRLQVLVGDRTALLDGNAERPELRPDSLEARCPGGAGGAHLQLRVRASTEVDGPEAETHRVDLWQRGDRHGHIARPWVAVARYARLEGVSIHE